MNLRRLLDEVIAELCYGENLPQELADSARFHKLLNLMRTAPAGYEPPKRRRPRSSSRWQRSDGVRRADVHETCQ